MNKLEFFLAKDSKVYGPFSLEEIENLKKTKKYFEYHWIWNALKQSWDPTDPAPNYPPITKNTNKEQKELEWKSKQTDLSFDKDTFSQKELESSSQSIHKDLESPKIQTPQEERTHFPTIAYNTKNFIFGIITKWSEQILILESDHPHTSPQFAIGSIVFLNILKENTNETQTKKVTLTNVDRKKNVWIYEFEVKH